MIYIFNYTISMKKTTNIIYENWAYRAFSSNLSNNIYVCSPYQSVYYDVLSWNRIRYKEHKFFQYPLNKDEYQQHYIILDKLRELEKIENNIVYWYNKDYISIIWKNTYTKMIEWKKFYLWRSYIFNTNSAKLLEYDGMVMRSSVYSNVYTFLRSDFIKMYSDLWFRDEPNINRSKKLLSLKYKSTEKNITRVQSKIRKDMSNTIYKSIIKYSMYMNNIEMLDKQIEIENKYWNTIWLLSNMVYFKEIDDSTLFKVIKKAVFDLDIIDENSDRLVIDKTIEIINTIMSQSDIST